MGWLLLRDTIHVGPGRLIDAVGDAKTLCEWALMTTEQGGYNLQQEWLQGIIGISFPRVPWVYH